MSENTTWSIRIHAFTVTMHSKEDDDDYHGDGMYQTFLDEHKCSVQSSRDKSYEMRSNPCVIKFLRH